MTNNPTLLSATVLATTVLLSSCSGGAADKPTKPSAAELMAAAEELDSLFLVAFNQGDAEALMQLYWNSAELRFYPPGEPQVSGFDAAKASIQRDFAGAKGARLEYTDANNIVLGDGVVGHGTFKWTMPMEGGEPMVMDGRYTEVKEMKNGRMVITVDHASAPMPAPAETAADPAAHE